MSVVYSRERRQFGQPIGRFQHVQNHIVQLVNHLDAARWTTYEALWKLDAGRGADVVGPPREGCDERRLSSRP